MAHTPSPVSPVVSGWVRAAGTASELVEQHRPAGALTGGVHEPAETVERVAQPLACLADDAVEILGVEAERPG